MENKTNIIFMLESGMINEYSGINTFMRHFVTMYKKEFKNTHNLFLLTHNIEDLDLRIQTELIADGVTILGSKKNSQPKYMDMSNVLEMAKDHNGENILLDSILITNTINSLEYVKDPELLKTVQKLIHYTHIGDILSEEFVKYDFDKKVVENYYNNLKYFKSIDTDNKFKILCQNQSIKDIMDRKIETNADIIWMPLYVNYTKFRMHADHVISIGGNYKRKRWDLMCHFISNRKKFLKIDKMKWYCAVKKEGSYNISELASRYDLIKDMTVNRVQNNTVSNLIDNAKYMLFLSDIEVCPYVILESIFKIPVVISDNFWGQGMQEYVRECEINKNNVILINHDNIDKFDLCEFESRITKNTNKDIIRSYNIYHDKFVSQWKNVL